ncbi:MAG: hypothetical protein HOV81_15260 [Kofleriaceae bacterium]|nr:hypothetical protein [Kofleriaceae bacterium]
MRVGTVYASHDCMRSLIPLATSFVLALTGVASAQRWQSPQTAPQNRQPQTEERYQARNQLADVRLNPGRDRAYIQLPRTGRPLDYLELRAGRARLMLDDVEVKFADGTSIHTGDRGVVQPFEGRVVNLPRRAAPVTAIVASYRTIGRRMPARLQVFGVPEHGPNRWGRRGRY